MKSVGQQIKRIRERKGFSQQELADLSGVSIRTIQRIEAGTNDPQGFTLRSICDSLGLPPEDLFENHLVENKGMIQALHLMPIFGFVFPLGNIIVPSIFWLANKNKYKNFDQQAKNLLFWQVILTGITSLVIMVGALGKLSHLDMTPFSSGDWILTGIILTGVSFVFIPLLITILIQFIGIKNFYPAIFRK